ncbi:MAG TPA: hypothetical protein VGM50_06040 [Gemmatimonadaceae bacterium]|jgi:hypothetical protein
MAGARVARGCTASTVERRELLDWVSGVVQQLDPLDREAVLLYLEGLDAASIGSEASIADVDDRLVDRRASDD